MKRVLNLNIIFKSQMTKTWCIGGTHYKKSISQNAYDKMNPKTKKLVKFMKGKCSICGRNNSQFFTM